MTTGLSTIRLRGVRQNNLRGLDLDLPKRSLIVVAGVSGSGKSSLVFDTIAAEAQRHINATFSSYAQSHLPSYGRPDADRIENLSAAIIIDQRRLHGGPRSTVGTITDIGDWLRMLFSQAAEPSIGYANAFSFNDPAGMCMRCHGLGTEKVIDEEAFLDESKSLREGPFRHPDYQPGKPAWRSYANSGLFDLDVPLEQYTHRERHQLLHAVPGEPPPPGALPPPEAHEGVLVRFRRVQLAKSPATLTGGAKAAYETLVTQRRCSECDGARLNEAARTASVCGMTLPQVYEMQAGELAQRMRGWELGPLAPLVADVRAQLQRLVDLGIGYLSLARETATLSGGEAQRVKMVRHLGSALNDMLYIFDEPTTGLHPRDVHRLGAMLLSLRDRGNTVIVVEHDTSIMAIADQVVEIGPGAGVHGGQLIHQGTFAGLRQADTPTGEALRAPFPGRREPRTPSGHLHIARARNHNLRDVSVDIPLGVLTAVTGVAGSGKSSLIHGNLPQVAPGAVIVDQSAIRGSRRSTPASWTGMLDDIRRLFAKRTGQPAALFSPNSDGGCRDCDGLGVKFLDLRFTDPVMAMCETCQGRRFRAAVSKYRVRGRSIADVFGMSVEEAYEFFTDRTLLTTLERMRQVGLGYLTLGQNLATLSGGERQRLKLARELTGDAPVVVLDEPTTGLHTKDTARLLALLHHMVEQGRTVIVIEHDLDIVASADHVIDLGPDGGHDGGRVQFTGTIEQLLRSDTHTGHHLKRRLGTAERRHN